MSDGQAPDTDSAIVHLSDGPRLVLADGSVVRMIVKDRDDNTELAFVGHDQGSAVYGEATGVNETASIAFVDDPDAADHELVKAAKRQFDVAGDGGGGDGK